MDLEDSLGLVLAEDVFSPLPFPHFDNSAVDGYALGQPSSEAASYQVKGEIPAGSFSPVRLKAGEALQIFTGAPVPKGTAAVIMQEHVERSNGHVTPLKAAGAGDHIRRRGEDFHQGTRLLIKGTLLESAHLAVMAAAGLTQAPVFPAPKTAFLTTGCELLKAGEKLKPGKIYDSNRVMLQALIRQNGGVPLTLGSFGDDPRSIRAAVRCGLKYDFLIISGGVSVGKYDFVKDALKKEGVREIFWKVNIKPGKPLYFGKKNNTLVFGLPGNPVSVFVTFEEYVKPALFQARGVRFAPRLAAGVLTREFRNGERLHFVRVAYCPGKTRNRVVPLKGQGSHQVGTLAQSNAIWAVPAKASFKKNQNVQVRLS